MKTMMDLIVRICLMVGIGVGAQKFYFALEKDLAIKLSTGLPKLSTFMKEMTK